MTAPTTMTSEWMRLGREFNETAAAEDRRGHRTADAFQAAVEAEIGDLTWHAPVDGVLSGPMSPILMLQAVIEQMELRGVVGYAYGGCLSYPDGPETATYGLLGVEVRTRSQHFRVHLLDTGLGAVPMRVDWFAGAPEPEDEPDPVCPDCNESPCHPGCLSGGGL